MCSLINLPAGLRRLKNRKTRRCQGLTHDMNSSLQMLHPYRPWGNQTWYRQCLRDSSQHHSTAWARHHARVFVPHLYPTSTQNNVEVICLIKSFHRTRICLPFCVKNGCCHPIPGKQQPSIAATTSKIYTVTQFTVNQTQSVETVQRCSKPFQYSAIAFLCKKAFPDP